MIPENPARVKRLLTMGCVPSLLVAIVLVVFFVGQHYDLPCIADPSPLAIRQPLSQHESACYVTELPQPWLSLNHQYLWRIDANPEAISAVIAHLQLIESQSLPSKFWQMPPHYWPREIKPGMKAYSSGNFTDDFIAADDGEHYLLLHDPVQGRAYVWLQDIF